MIPVTAMTLNWSERVRFVDGAFKKAIHLNGGVVQMAQNDFIVPIGEKGEITMEAWFYLNQHASYDGIISIEARCGVDVASSGLW